MACTTYMKYFYLPILILLSACAAQKFPSATRPYQFPVPIDTKTRAIAYQKKQTFVVGDVSASNQFPAARLNDFTKLDETTYRATISPENAPINNSPWYAFQLWSAEKQEINLQLYYTEHKHRYTPKISRDGENWELLDPRLIQLDADSVHATLQLTIDERPLWIAAQEIQDSRRVWEWMQGFENKDFIQNGSAGVSVQGRALFYMNIDKNPAKKKPTIIIISRQHPPEVTGYLAMKAFVETLVDEGGRNSFLDKYRIMVYPLMNPDGVDLGHHRHNTAGIDMNRDWSFYRQPEIQQITNHMVRETSANKNDVVLGLDFHSTHYDIYYTFDDTVERKLPGFTKAWLEKIRVALNIEDINESPAGFGAPISKGWFNKQFGAESITYEIGDDTPRDFIKKKGVVSARAMMELLK